MADEERPQYQHGVGTIGGSQFHWGVGLAWAVLVDPLWRLSGNSGRPNGGMGAPVGAIPIANNVIPDPLLHRDRIGIMIHSGSASSLDALYTQGCFKVAPQEWPAVRSEILKEASNGPLYLHVAPGGVAAFTNTKTFSQAGDETPAANANAAANTTAHALSRQARRPDQPSPLRQFVPWHSLANAESGDRNIFSGVDNATTWSAWIAQPGNVQIDCRRGSRSRLNVGGCSSTIPIRHEARRPSAAQVVLDDSKVSRVGQRTP